VVHGAQLGLQGEVLGATTVVITVLEFAVMPFADAVEKFWWTCPAGALEAVTTS
jgi:hypothetical protein